MINNNKLLQAGLRLIVITSLLAFLQACASYGHEARSMRGGLMKGRADLSLAAAEEKDKGQEEVLPSLDKGMLRRMNNDFTGSNRVFEVAKQQIEELYGISITENLASVTINETLRAYEGDRYEQLLLHVYMAMNYIQLGQLDSARVEMLQANVKMMEWGDEPEEDAFMRYFEGIVYEALGELDEALVSYRKAYIVYREKGGEIYPQTPIGLKEDLLRLLSWQGLKSEFSTLKKEMGMDNYSAPRASNSAGDLIVILNNGLAPIRSERALPIYSTEVQQNLRVAFPVYSQPRQVLSTPKVKVSNGNYSLEPVEDVDTLARHALEEAMPGIMARATARAVVKYNSQQNANNNSSIAGLLMTVTNLVTERADTRSWSTLPQEIEMKRITLPVGQHEVRLQMTNAAGRVVDEMVGTVNIKPKGTSFFIRHWNAPVPRLKAEKHSDKQKQEKG